MTVKHKRRSIYDGELIRFSLGPHSNQPKAEEGRVRENSREVQRLCTS